MDTSRWILVELVSENLTTIHHSVLTEHAYHPDRPLVDFLLISAVVATATWADLVIVNH